MAEVLYRKYRSRSFAEVQGQEAIVSILVNSLRTDKFSHAYLFAGPRGTGKTTIARLVAKAVNCERFIIDGDVCNQCASCKAVESGNHLDVVEIDAASNRGIEEIRQIRDTLNFLPSSGKFKVYIIDEAHMLTREACNALLKTLEEPPAHVIFILATTEPYKVPMTILSRVQRFDFKLATVEQLTAKLSMILDQEGYKAEPSALQLIYRYSEGSYRDAESILGKILSGYQGKEVISISRVSELLGMPSAVLVTEFSRALVSGATSEAILLLDEAASAGVDIAHLVKSVVSGIREDLMAKVIAGKPYTRELQVLHTLMVLQSEVKMADDARLLLEVAILKLNLKPEPEEKKHVRKKSAPITNVSIEAPWKRLLAEVRKVDFQLWTVLKSCKATYTNNILRLETVYQSNVSLLQKPESISKIKPLIDTAYSTDATLEVVLDPAAEAEAQQESDLPPDDNVSLVEEIF